MNINKLLKQLYDEAKALKAGFDVVGENILIFEYKVEAEEFSSMNTLLTLETDDGSNTIATVTNMERAPFAGPNTWQLRWFLKPGDVIIIRSLRKGRVYLHEWTG